MSCDYQFGCHSCKAKLLELHATIRHELSIPVHNQERIREGLISVKRFIEDIVGVEE